MKRLKVILGGYPPLCDNKKTTRWNRDSQVYKIATSRMVPPLPATTEKQQLAQRLIEANEKHYERNNLSSPLI